MPGGMSGESLLLKPYRTVGPCGSGLAPSRQVMNSCRPIAALAAYHLCFVAEVVGRRCASSAHRCAWSARMRTADIASEKAGLESVPYAQSGDDAR